MLHTLPNNETKKVNLKPLKKWVEENLPTNSTLRNIILSENDILSSEHFIVKIDVWQKLLRMESHQASS